MALSNHRIEQGLDILGDVETSIVNGTVDPSAGGGVVADSIPEDEYQESCNKAKALMAAANMAKKFDFKD